MPTTRALVRSAGMGRLYPFDLCDSLNNLGYILDARKNRGDGRGDLLDPLIIPPDQSTHPSWVFDFGCQLPQVVGHVVLVGDRQIESFQTGPGFQQESSRLRVKRLRALDVILVNRDVPG